MSFQIKKTHRFLQPAQPAPKPTVESYLSKDDEKSKDYEWMNKSATAPSKASKPDSSKGLSIKSSYRAQEDFM